MSGHYLHALGPSYIYTGPELEPQNGALRDANAQEFFDTYDVQIVNGIAEVRRKKHGVRPTIRPTTSRAALSG